MRHARLAFLFVTILFPAQLSADFHFMSIKEVFPGTSTAPNARYVMLQMYFGGQNNVVNHPVIFYNATGAETNRFTFSGPVGNGADQATLLIATTEAQTLFGITPDLLITVPGAMIPAGGKVCFDVVDCMSWGNYTGSTAGVGNPFNPSGGLTAGQAARRRMDVFGSPTTLQMQDDTGDSANDFRFAPPRPRNNAGQTVTVISTTTSLMSSANPSTVGDSVTFTAVVMPMAATGSVSFKDGDTVIGTGTLTSGSASFTTSILPQGAHSITAVYGGDLQYDPSTSPVVMQIVNAATLTPPAMFSAVATSPSAVALSWSAVSGATGYEVFRSTSVSAAYTVAVMTSNTAAMDGLPVSANTTYLYMVRTLGPGGPSAFSSVDAATTTIFDDPALAGVTIKASHVLQVRTAVNAMRTAAALAPAFSGSSLAGVTIQAVHITELRDALNPARAAIGLTAIVYTDPTITPGVTTVKADHVQQPRNGTQ